MDEDGKEISDNEIFEVLTDKLWHRTKDFVRFLNIQSFAEARKLHEKLKEMVTDGSISKRRENGKITWKIIEKKDENG